ncbi:MAG: type II toxin-antitoxin system RelE/ParE family toxin [Alphaproteobacteria bacterium]|nr:type II toxin-antitoxin system RelE/ParE family toxin [Alphaproteobacteria bacterium]
MDWKIELDSEAERDLDKLDSQTARRILRFLHGRVAVLDDPRSIGAALRGAGLGGYWRYRVGDYRIVARIDDDTVTVLVLRLGHRSSVYAMRR